MSNRVLDKLNKYRTKAKPPPEHTEKNKVDAGTVPIEDLALDSVQDAWDLMEDFQRMRVARTKYSSTLRDADEDDIQFPRKQQGHKDCVLPKWRKKNHPDYRPGKVKVYTDKEIAQYMEERDGIPRI